MILDSSDSLILGDIEVTPSLTRSEAEDILRDYFHFSGKTRKENSELVFANIKNPFDYSNIRK